MIFCSSTSATTDFLWLLESKNINTQDLLEADTVPRETVAELLNLVDCQDCHRPSQSIIQSLTSSWRQTFRTYPGKNFDDIAYNNTPSQENMYYCIAYVGNKWYMNWYPRSTSPLCSWRFCGGLDITNADVIQTVFNITAQTFYNQYSADRKTIATRLQTQPQNIQNYFDLKDRAMIISSAQACTNGSGCTIKSIDALQAYAKYCTLEADSCGMRELPFAKKSQWPIAEMNMLLQQGIFTPSDIQNLNIENYASGKFVVEMLGRVKSRVQCIDDDDQDDDGIKDYADNCYLTYNPTQRDTDSDRIGDVCDDDIDGDTIKNPVGVVDDLWNIIYAVIKAYTQTMDNCLFVVNTNQQDTDSNNIWNACDIENPVGIRINPKQLTPDRFVFVAQYSWNLTNFNWFFGDQNTGSGEVVSHTYNQAQQYTVRVEATTPANTIVTAYTTVTVLWPRASLLPNKLVQHVWENVWYTILLANLPIATIDYVDLQRGDGRSRQLRWQEIAAFTDTYLTQWGYAIYGSVYTRDGKTLPIGAYVTVLWWDFCMWFNMSYWAGHCDMNQDTIPDLCDTDIDGDGVQNPLWLILYENPDCSYDNTNTVSTPNQNTTTSGLTNTTIAGWDTCPFVFNTNQWVCTPLTGSQNIDTDQDGILDNVDACPTLPETINGVTDQDGCPEIAQTFSFPSTTLQAGACLACPCQYAQNDTSLTPWDRVKAVLYDSGTNQYVTESDWYIVP